MSKHENDIRLTSCDKGKRQMASAAVALAAVFVTPFCCSTCRFSNGSARNWKRSSHRNCRCSLAWICCGGNDLPRGGATHFCHSIHDWHLGNIRCRSMVIY